VTQLKIGLTGGIASGKSQVSRLFSKLKIDVIDADEIARSLFKTGSPLLASLKARFGENIFNDDTSLNRKALGKIVFNNPDDLKWLNQLTHPEVSKEINRQLLKVSSPYVILDIPLLVDKSGLIPEHLKQLVDRVLVIDTNLENQLIRLCARDNISIEEAQAVINTQSSLDQKLEFADDVICNNTELSALESQVELLHNQYIVLAKSLANKA
jgi:dephospho-CoA kinase